MTTRGVASGPSIPPYPSAKYSRPVTLGTEALSIRDMGNVFQAEKLPIEVQYRVAKVAEEVATREGPVTCQAGDFIITGKHDDVWPVPGKEFDSKYESISDTVARKKTIRVLARQMSSDFSVILPNQDHNVIRGRAGGYAVQYKEDDPTDCSAIDEKIFNATYRRV